MTISNHQNSAAQQPQAENRSRTGERAVPEASGHRPGDRTHRVYSRAVALLEAGKVQEALDVVRSQSSSDPVLKNLTGVCLLRAGRSKEAVRVYRALVMTSSSLTLRKDVPTEFKTNFAAALLLDGHVAGCRGVLGEIQNEQHPAVCRLRNAIAAWRSGLSFWQRLQDRCGLEPDVPVRLDFLPGDLV